MAKRVHSIDRTKYKTIGPIYYDMPGDSAAAAGRPIFAIDGALRSVLRDVFTSHPEQEPADYKDRDGDDDLVFQEVAPKPTEPLRRYTFIVGYVPVENI